MKTFTIAIDPGTTCTGIALAYSYRKKCYLLDYAYVTEIKSDSTLPTGNRIPRMSNRIYQTIINMISKHPYILDSSCDIAIETIYYGSNPSSTILQGRLLQCIEDVINYGFQSLNINDVSVIEYHPNTAKASIKKGSISKQEAQDEIKKIAKISRQLKTSIEKIKSKAKREAIYDALIVAYTNFYKKGLI